MYLRRFDGFRFRTERLFSSVAIAQLRMYSKEEEHESNKNIVYQHVLTDDIAHVFPIMILVLLVCQREDPFVHIRQRKRRFLDIVTHADRSDSDQDGTGR